MTMCVSFYAFRRKGVRRGEGVGYPRGVDDNLNVSKKARMR